MSKLKQTLIKTLVTHYAHKSEQKMFTQKVLQSMSVRTLNNFNKDELGDLLNHAFRFFNQHVTKAEAQFHLFNSQKHQGSKKQVTALEIASPDANQLLLTIECLIDSLNLRMTRKLHPVFDISNTGALLQNKATSSKPYTYIYIAFSSTLDTHIIKTLKEKLSFHLKAITCVEKDRLPILEALDRDIKQLSKNSSKDAAFQEWRALLTWLRAANFSFFGFKNNKHALGICSKNYATIDPKLKPILQKTYAQKSAISFTQIAYKSPVYRFEGLMCLKFYDPTSQTDLYCFGLLRRSSLNTNNLETPIIREKIDYIFKALDVKVHSYNYSEIVRIFVQTPKFELFRSSKEALLEIVENILSVTNPNHIQCFFKKNHFTKTHFLMIVMPPFLFTRRNTKLLLEEFSTQFPIKNLEYIAIPGVDLCRLHLYFESAKKTFSFEEESFERTLGERLKSMEDKLNDFIEDNLSSKDANYIKKHYVPFIPYHYQVRTHPKDLLDDLIAIDQLNSKKNVAFRCMPFNFPAFSDLAGRASLLKIYSLQKMDLIHIIPVLENLGLYVIDQLTARIGTKTQTKGFVQSFRIQGKAGKKIEDPQTKRYIEALLDEVYGNRFENDPLNALVLAGLSHQQIALFLMYRNYFLQCDPAFSAQHINYALCQYPKCTKILLDYFETRFNPRLKLSQEKRQESLDHYEADFNKALQAVSFIQHDFSFRQFLLMMKATLRCNYYQEDKLALVIKLNPEAIPVCPKPKPFREMFVYNHSLEGVHLRFGPIARGGLRFSNRNFDFRREVLLLAQTQRAKNVVIVPNGAKGGFIIKQNTKPDGETIAQKYQDFITTLLSITDNQLPNGKKERPKACVLHDNFDPYLVVAADKGTATFSDLANSIAQKRGFWLDDAFASGGSQGYDHKKYGITAKGAWECLRLHSQEHGFKENDILTCIGIGDMSGDVFGNGLIESKTLKLHAAFNHIHIFIDPNPDPESSWKERNRLFKKNRSTWRDYEGFSKGGGVFDRDAKSIKLSKEIKTLLGIDASSLSGPDLIKAILALQVDFIWFGGIGTYIKSESESHLEIGDQNNDSVRVNTEDIKAAIISEGANSGLSMPARIQLSNQGVRLNTDAIDNSAGVSMSDYEVNLKIFAKGLIESKKLKSQKERDTLLFRIDKEVTRLVLNTNQEQHRLISLEQLRSKKDGRKLLAFIKQLVSEDLLNLKEEQLPSINTLESFVETHQAFPRPLLAVLQAYIKQLAYDELQNSPIVDKPLFVERFIDYFPSYIQKNYAKELLEHPLKKAITALQMVNETINYTGISFLYNMQQLMHKSYSEIMEMYLFVSDLTQINPLRQAILKSQVSSDAKYQALLEINSSLEKITRIFLSDQFCSFIKTQHLQDYKTLFKNLQKEASHYFCVAPTAYRDLGFDAKLANLLSQYHLSLHLPDVLFLSFKQKIPIAFISDLIFEAAPVLGLDWLEEQLDMQQSTVFWDHMQKQKLAKQMTNLKITLLSWVYSLDKKQPLTQVSFDQRLQLCHSSIIKKANHYFNHLSKLKQKPEDINLTSLNVCIQQLDELCYAIKHH